MKKYLIISSILLTIAFIFAIMSTISYKTLVNSKEIEKVIENKSFIQLKYNYKGLLKINYTSNCTQLIEFRIGNKYFRKYSNELEIEFIGELKDLKIKNNSTNKCFTKLNIYTYKVNMPYRYLAIPALLLLIIGIAILSIWFIKKITM